MFRRVIIYGRLYGIMARTIYPLLGAWDLNEKPEVPEIAREVKNVGVLTHHDVALLMENSSKLILSF